MIKKVKIGSKSLMYDLTAFAALQEAFEVDDLMPIFRTLEQGKIDAVKVSVMLWAGLLHDEDDGFSIKDAKAFVKGWSLSDVCDPIGKALASSFGPASASTEGNAQEKAA